MSSDGIPNIDVDIQRLKATCLACPELDVTSEQGGDWSVLPCDLHPKCRSTLVDVYSSQDPYPEEFWRAATEYFEGLGEHNMRLPGGRYSCAQALVARRLEFLAGRSLGQVCHIVQLAISRRKILGYLNGAVVPHGRSQSMVKERCAQMNRPCEGSGTGSRKVADWPAVRKCLSQIMRSIVRANGSMPLSNVKRLFRSRFQLLLSETALGHAKLSELLQDTRLSDICSVKLKGNVYLVLPPEAKKATANGCKTISLVEELSLSEIVRAEDIGAVEEQPQELALTPGVTFIEAPAAASTNIPHPPSGPPPPRFMMPGNNEDSTFNMPLRTVVKNTFIHTEPDPSSPIMRARRRHMTLPTNLLSIRSVFSDDDYDRNTCPSHLAKDEDVQSCSTGSPGSASSKGGLTPRRKSAEGAINTKFLEPRRNLCARQSC